MSINFVDRVLIGEVRQMERVSWTIVIHGGAGAMRSMGAQKEAEYREGLRVSVLAGASVLRDGGSALSAAMAAVRSMEAGGAFNAGHGSCLNLDGVIEVDAAVMDGHDLSMGAIAAAPGIANGVMVADAIRQNSPHCLFAGESVHRLAEKWADLHIEKAIPSEDRLARWKKQCASYREDELDAQALTQYGGTHDEGDTVGAVVVDSHGGLAAAVSTGGIWLKVPGRVGDSPLPGSGFWAENELVACCATGTGEFIMRAGLCADIRARCQAGDGVKTAVRDALTSLSERFGHGKAGVIAVGANGEFSAPFDTAGMGRAWMKAQDAEPTVRVWPEEDV
jgi:beta-aspartyl-peptidase (threonine type)